MSDDPIGDAVRKTRRRRKVPPGTGCLFCGEDDPDCLVEVDLTILVEHHMFGVGNLPDTAWLCPTCHRKLHVGLLDGGVDLSHKAKRILLEVVRIVLLASAVTFRALADTYEWLAHKLGEFIESLDAEDPEWRQLPEAAL